MELISRKVMGRDQGKRYRNGLDRQSGSRSDCSILGHRWEVQGSTAK